MTTTRYNQTLCLLPEEIKPATFFLPEDDYWDQPQPTPTCQVGLKALVYMQEMFEANLDLLDCMDRKLTLKGLYR